MSAGCDSSASVAARILTTLTTITCLGATILYGTPAWAERPSTDKHVRELAQYLDGVKIAKPVMHQQLAVYPIFVEDVPLLRGRWLTLDKAISQGVLTVSEKGKGSVPVIRVENHSRNEHVFIMTGEVIAGGMQTRTVRHDVVLAPGQKIDLDVFCVEARRWAGPTKFLGGSKTMLPQSIQEKVRGGADQAGIWSEIARNNRELNAENPTDNLDAALQAAPVREKLEEVRRKIISDIPPGTMGFIFVTHGRPLGAEMFGSDHLARQLLPKLIDSYAVDYLILRKPANDRGGKNGDRAAIKLFERICRAGSQRATTPGSGAGIRTRAGGLLGDGVSLDGTLVHYGVQVGEQVKPRPKPQPARPPRPPIIYPNPQQYDELDRQRLW